MRILALVPGGIGDQILFFPTLDDLRAYYPEAEINVIVEPRAKGAYRVCKSVDEVLTFDFKDRNGLADFGYGLLHRGEERWQRVDGRAGLFAHPVVDSFACLVALNEELEAWPHHVQSLSAVHPLGPARGEPHPRTSRRRHV